MKVFNPIQDTQYIELSTSKKENEMLVLSKYKKEIERIKEEFKNNIKF